MNTALFNVDDGTFSFLQDVLDEAMAIFPSTYIHVGGDEAAKDEWENSKFVQSKMKLLGVDNEEKMQGWFMARIGRYLDQHSRRLIGWDEILDGAVPASATVMSWRGPEGAIKAARAGHDVVIAPSPVLYMDHVQSTLPDEQPGIPRVQTLEAVYNFDPVPASLDVNEGSRVLGAEATVFIEYLPNGERTQHALFPRLAAVAERAWSPKADWNEFVARLPSEMARYRVAGVAPSDGAFAVSFSTHAEARGKARVTLSNQTSYGTIRYTTDGSLPTVRAAAYTQPFEVDLPTTVRANTFYRSVALADPRRLAIDEAPLMRRSSEQLAACDDNAPLRVEAPEAVNGVRPVYRVDLMNTCWIWKGAALDGLVGLNITVNRLPFSYALWTITILKLEEALDGRGTLQGRLPRLSGVHDLCWVITGKTGPTIWVIDNVQLR